MNRITLKEYAVKHKLSVFNVLKMVKSGKLNSEESYEDDKKTIYVILDEKTEKEVENSIIPPGIDNKNDLSLKEEVTALTNEIKLLREEVELLKKMYGVDL